MRNHDHISPGSNAGCERDEICAAKFCQGSKGYAGAFVSVAADGTVAGEMLQHGDDIP